MKIHLTNGLEADIDEADAEKVLAAVRIQDKALRQPQQKEAQ